MAPTRIGTAPGERHVTPGMSSTSIPLPSMSVRLFGGRCPVPAPVPGTGDVPTPSLSGSGFAARRIEEPLLTIGHLLVRAASCRAGLRGQITKVFRSGQPQPAVQDPVWRSPRTRSRASHPCRSTTGTSNRWNRIRSIRSGSVGRCQAIESLHRPALVVVAVASARDAGSPARLRERRGGTARRRSR